MTLALLPLLSAALAAAPAVPCEPSPEVAAVIEAADDMSGDPMSARMQVPMLMEALQSHPGDLFLREALLSARLSTGEDPAALAAELKAAGTGDPVGAYLHARAAAEVSPDEGLALAKQALQAFPRFPWPNLLVAKLMRGPKTDPAGAASAIRAFQRACPRAVRGLEAASRLTDTALARDSARALRETLEARTGGRGARSWRTVWGLEAKAGLAGRPDWKERVAADVKRLRAAPGEPGRERLEAIAEGAQLSGDAAAASWAQGELDRRFANPYEQFMGAAMRFYSEQGAPDRNCSPDAAQQAKQDAFDRAFGDATADWVKRWPDLVDAWRERLDSVSRRAGAPPAEVDQAAARVRALASKPGAGASAVLNVADAYAELGMHLDEVPALVEQGLAGAAEREKQTAFFVRQLPPEAQAQVTASAGSEYWQGSKALIKAWLKLKKLDAVAERIAALRSRLEQDRAAAKDAERRATLDRREAVLWQAAADLALARGQKADAVAFLARIERHNGCDAAHASPLLQRAWKELGGTRDGLAQLLEGEASKKPEAKSAWTDASLPLPPFSARDLGGRAWGPKDLRGKIVFGTVWATWCEPCKAELAFVRKLRERYAGRKDVVIITLNADANPALVKPFAERERFDGPVLMGSDLADKLGLATMLPSAFVVDPSGTVRFTARGLIAEGEERWITSASEVIDRVSAR